MRRPDDGHSLFLKLKNSTKYGSVVRFAFSLLSAGEGLCIGRHCSFDSDLRHIYEL